MAPARPQLASLSRVTREAAARGGRPSRRASRAARPEPSGLVDLGAMMAHQPNWLDEAVARSRAKARPSQLFAHASISLDLPVPQMPSSPAAAESPRQRAHTGRWAAACTAIFLALAAVLAVHVLHLPLPKWPTRQAFAALAPTQTPTPAPTPAPIETPMLVPTTTTTAVIIATATAAPRPTSAADELELDAITRPSDKKHGRHAQPSTVRTSAKATKHAAARSLEASREAAPPPAPHSSTLAASLREAAGATNDTPPAAPAAAAPAPAAAPPPPQVTTAAANRATSGRPDRPSGNLVANALLQGMPAARACLGDVLDTSRASVTFGPEGDVVKVDVSGPAAHDAKASACIRNAFGKAHVPPFAEASYSASVNVRPR